MKRWIVTVLLFCVADIGAFALPPAFQDSTWDGSAAGGVFVSVDPLNGKWSIGFELYWLSRSGFGVGLTESTALPRFKIDSGSIDGLYSLDTHAAANGRLTVPMKVRFGLFGDQDVTLGVGVAAGLEYYAVPFDFDDNDNMYVSSNPAAAGFFATVKGLAEVDWVKGKFIPSLSLGGTLAGTIGGDAGGGGYYYYYY